MVEEFSRRYFFAIATERSKGKADLADDGSGPRVMFNAEVEKLIAGACELPQYKDLYNEEFQVLCRKHLGTPAREGPLRQRLIQKYMQDRQPDVVRNKVWVCEQELGLCEKGQALLPTHVAIGKTERPKVLPRGKTKVSRCRDCQYVAADMHYMLRRSRPRQKESRFHQVDNLEVVLDQVCVDLDA